MRKCEEELEALKREIESLARELIARCDRGKEKLAVLREYYNLELEKAVNEVCLHSLEQGVLENGSLEAIITGSEPISALFSYRIQTNVSEMRHFLQIQFEMALRTLTHLNYCDGVVENPSEIPISSDSCQFTSLSEVKDTSNPYMSPKPGFSFLVFCLNPNCRFKNQAIYLEKGFGEFNLAEISSNLSCPSCEKSIKEATSCGFYQANGKFEGELHSLEVVESVIIADNEEFRQLIEIGDRAWRYIIIKCCNLQS